MSAKDGLIDMAKSQVGYLEKASNKNLDDFTANAGDKNFTKYARDIRPDLQGEPWCDMFVDWCFWKTFGDKDAKLLLCDSTYSAYTPTSANYYKAKGQYHTSPQVGDQIFFHNGTRIYHTGIVYKVDSSYVYTIEGNTSSGSEVVANGGAVCYKSYALSNSKIDGYGRPDYSIAEVGYSVGWNRDSNGWWYADSEDTYYMSKWALINHHWYYFNPDGYAVTNWQEINGNWYYFEPRAGHELECAMYVSTVNGEQFIGEF